MRTLDKKSAAELLGQINLIKENNKAIKLAKDFLHSYEEVECNCASSKGIYKNGIKLQSKKLKELKERRKLLDRGLSYIMRELKTCVGKTFSIN